MIADDLKVLLQHVVPQQLLSRCMGGLAGMTYPSSIKNYLIKKFIQHYGVNMAEAIHSAPEQYNSFNDFFTRQLLPQARTIDRDPKTIICPADGTISEIGKITDNRLLQAKGHQYELSALLAGRTDLVERFTNGSFSTIYLAPKDYHRVHMPIDGQLQEMIHVPGKLFSVNFTTAAKVPNLFARNERVINVFQTQIGSIAVILVGAMIVASIATRWAGIVSPPRRKMITTHHYDDVLLNKADELGYFQLGSTVILLFQPHTMQWQASCQSGHSVRMGQAIATQQG